MTVTVPLWLAVIGGALATIGGLACLSALGVWVLYPRWEEVPEDIDDDPAPVDLRDRLKPYTVRATTTHDDTTGGAA